MDGHAVVVGASIAGLSAARVLSRRYGTVTLLDRDTLPQGATPRRGVPQGSHGHILLVAGLRALAGLFPGLQDGLVEAGATVFDPGLDLCTYRYGRRWPKAPTGLDLVSLSRPRLEAVIRDRVTAEPGVTVRDQVAVTGLTGTGGRVTGVVLDTGDTLTADLVVDGTGRAGGSDRWMAERGFPVPDQVQIKAGVAYTTRTYRRGPGDLPDWKAILTLPTAPRQNTMGVVLPLEGDRWLIAMGGWHIDAPPRDAASFEAAARALPDPAMSEVMARAAPLTGPTALRFPSSRRRLFEKLERMPAGYVALGDAICSFNPIYGQGMTCAVQQAVALGATLDRHGEPTADMARDFYRAAAAVIVTPWRFAVGGDFAYPQTTGPRPRGVTLTNWYARRISLASQLDPEISSTFLSVQHLVTPPEVLFRPRMIARVLRLAGTRTATPCGGG